jgi:glyoxylase I family protein
MIKGLAHICIGTQSLEKTRHFYCSILGFTKVFDFVQEGKPVGFYLDTGNGVFAEFFEQPDVAIPPKGPIWHFCLEVDDIDTEIDNLRRHGIEITQKELGKDFSWQAWFKDPNGVDIEFHQYTPQSTQITREVCRLE